MQSHHRTGSYAVKLSAYPDKAVALTPEADAHRVEAVVLGERTHSHIACTAASPLRFCLANPRTNLIFGPVEGLNTGSVPWWSQQQTCLSSKLFPWHAVCAPSDCKGSLLADGTGL